MDFTFFSFIMAVVWVSIFAKATSALRKQMFLLRYFSIYPLLFVLFFCILRLIFSFELPYTMIINSKKILPSLQYSLYKPFMHLNEIDINLIKILLAFWIAVAMIRFFKILIEHCRLYRLLQFLPATDDERLYYIFSQVGRNDHFSKSLKIIVHKSVRSPAIIGFFSPIIILPDIDFTDDELFGIFTHEWMHFHSGHALIKFTTEMIHSFFWWNPAFKELYNEVTHALEMHSDKKVCYILDKQQQVSYLNAIAKVISNLNGEKNVSTVLCSFVEDGDYKKLEQRFKMILEGNYCNKGGRNIFVIPLICFVFALSYMFVPQPYSEPDIEKYGSMQIISGNSYLIKTDTGYELYGVTDNYIADIAYIDDSLANLKIYNSMEDIP